jgi:hypothetical protein
MEATTKFDARRPTPLDLSWHEKQEIEAQIAEGTLPADYLAQCAEAAAQATFGHDYKRDRRGEPIQQGVGSPGNMTRQSIDAYRRWHSQDEDFQKNLAIMEKQLLECNERRKHQPDPRKSVIW